MSWGQIGEHPVGLEPRHVGRVVYEHRRACGRAEHPRRSHGVPHERVDEGRLAGAGRATHDRQQRRIDLDQPGQDVVLELSDHLLPGGPGGIDTWHVERQRGGR